MSETLLETAQTPNEAGSSTEPVTPPAAAAAEPGNTQQPSSEQPAPAAEPAKEPPAAAQPEGAPEQYTFTAPEGQAYDPQVLTAFSEAAKTANLTQDAAQKLIETMTPALAARQAEQLTAIHKGWADAVLTDTELGGELGSDQFKQKMGVAQKFIKTFDQDGKLAKLLEDTGLGNHPDLLRVLYRGGKAISEDTIVTRGNRERAAADPLDVLYPTTKKKE